MARPVNAASSKTQMCVTYRWGCCPKTFDKSLKLSRLVLSAQKGSIVLDTVSNEPPSLETSVAVAIPAFVRDLPEGHYPCQLW